MKKPEETSTPEELFEHFLNLKSHEKCVKFIQKYPERAARIIYFLTKELCGNQERLIEDSGRDNNLTHETVN
jgi:hypothetical protein